MIIILLTSVYSDATNAAAATEAVMHGARVLEIHGFLRAVLLCVVGVQSNVQRFRCRFTYSVLARHCVLATQDCVRLLI